MISLNFETAWLSGEQKLVNEAVGLPALSGLLKTGRKRLASYTLANDRRVWFPNGRIDDRATLRLGLRDFGLHPSEVQFGFQLLKRFERNHLHKAIRNASAADLRMGEMEIRQYLDIDMVMQVNADYPLTWVADFIYRPLIFAGVGLSQDELGLWWLLNQRQRNFAHLGREHNPPAYILLRSDDRRMSFWNGRPCGLEPLVCSDWEEGWKMVGRKCDALIA